MALLIRDGKGPSHNVLVESRKGKDYKSFSIWMHECSVEELTAIMNQVIDEAEKLLNDDWDFGLKRDKNTHKIRVLVSRLIDVRQRYVMARGICKPYHSSEEVVEALKSVLVKEGYTV